MVWTPADLANLRLWIDPADAATHGLASGKLVSLADKSGRNGDLSYINEQTATLNSEANGRTSFRAGANGASAFAFFEGSGADFAAFIRTGDFSVFNACWTPPSGSAGSTDYKSPFSIWDNVPLQRLQSSANTWRRWSGSGTGSASRVTSTYPSTPLTGDGHNQAAITSSIVSTTAQTWINGSRVEDHAVASRANSESANLYYGANWHTANRGWSSRVMDLIVTAGLTSQTDREKAEGYLAWKWGMASILPAAHPYKSDHSLFSGVAPAPSGAAARMLLIF